MTDQLDLFTYDKPRAEDCIIRCKDCKHFAPQYKPVKGEPYPNCMIQEGMLEPHPEGYCSYAERKIAQ